MKDFDEVIAKHKVLLGAKDMHVTLGDEATPENLDISLTDLGNSIQAYAAFSAEERLLAQIARLEGILETVNQIADTRVGETPGMAQTRLARIWSLTGSVPDVDLEVDTAFMQASRLKRQAAA